MLNIFKKKDNDKKSMNEIMNRIRFNCSTRYIFLESLKYHKSEDYKQNEFEQWFIQDKEILTKITGCGDILSKRMIKMLFSHCFSYCFFDPRIGLDGEINFEGGYKRDIFVKLNKLDYPRLLREDVINLFLLLSFFRAIDYKKTLFITRDKEIENQISLKIQDFGKNYLLNQFDRCCLNSALYVSDKFATHCEYDLIIDIDSYAKESFPFVGRDLYSTERYIQEIIPPQHSISSKIILL